MTRPRTSCGAGPRPARAKCCACPRPARCGCCACPRPATSRFRDLHGRGARATFACPLLLVVFLLHWAGSLYRVHAQETPSPVERALSAGRNGEVEQAVRLLEQVPGGAGAEAWNTLGEALFEAGKYQPAAECFRRVSEVRPDLSAPVAYQGLCRYHLGDYERALILLQRARVMGIDAGTELGRQTRLVAGLLLNRMGEHVAAFETLEGFALGTGIDEAALLGLGLSALQLPFLPEEIPPDRRPAVRLAGEATWATAAHQFAAAERLYRELVDRYPRQEGVHYALGVFLMRDRRDEGIQRFVAELGNHPRHLPALLQLAFEHIERGESERALEYARRAAEVDPGSYKVQYALGWAMLEGGDAAGAVTALEAAVRLEPTISEPRFALSRAYQRLGRSRDAARERQEFQRLSEMEKTIRTKVRQ